MQLLYSSDKPVNSRPCHIQSNNWDVALPQFAAVLEASCTHASVSTDSPRSFIASCRLALLVRRLQNEVCVLSARTSTREAIVTEILVKVDGLWGEWRSVTARPTGVSESLEGRKLT